MDEIQTILRSKARPEQLEGMARYGIIGEKRLGVSIPEMRAIAKQVGKNHQLALDLYQTGIPDAMILASMVDIPDDVSRQQMEDWVEDFASWDVCDQVCLNLFDKAPFAWEMIPQWAERPEEYVKRAAFALIACLAWHDKNVPDERFINLFLIIRNGTTDERNIVKKAVSWALRNIGKRNISLNKAAIQEAEEIRTLKSKSARWVANDVLRDLRREKVQSRLRSRI